MRVSGIGGRATWRNAAAWSSLAAAALWLGGCAAGPNPPAEESDAALPSQPGGAGLSADGVESPLVLRVDPAARLEASPPLGIDADAVRPLTGEALERARTERASVMAALPLPPALAGAADATPALPENEPDAGPSLATQRLFAAALQQGLEGQGGQAVRLLEAAAQQHPNQPALVRRLALGWAALGNRVRATTYFQQAVTANPDDLESVVALGRLLIESGDADQGTAALLHSLERADRLAALDPALPSLTRFYASAGLRKLGYIAASAELLDAFFEGADDALRPSRYGAELLFLQRRQAIHAVARGDLHAQLGEFRRARLAYERARRGGASGDDLTRRVVFADLWLGRIDEATHEVLKVVQEQSASPASLALVEYLVDSGVPVKPLVNALRALPADDEAGRHAMTLALASALPRDAAVSLLGDFLDAQPADDRVYEKLLARLLDEEATPADRSAALRRAAAAMEADPPQAARRAGAVLALGGDPAALREALSAIEPALRETPAMQTLEAVVLLELGERDAAEACLDSALASAASPPLAKIEKARLLALRDDFAGAQAMLESLDPEAQDPRLGQLRVSVLLELKRDDEALVLLDELIAQHADDPRFPVQKARLLLRAERVADAERALLDSLNSNPRSEALYAELLELYDAHGPALEGHPQGYQRLLRRMLETIPQSRIARLTYAGILEVQGQHDRAELLLDELLKDNPEDRDAQLVLLDVYAKTGRLEQAEGLVDRLLTADPQNPEVLRAAVSHYRRTNNPQGLAEVEERWLRAQEPSLSRDLSLARLLGRQGRTDEALGVLEGLADAAQGEQRNAVHFVTIEVLREQPLELAEPRLRAMVVGDGVDPMLRRIASYALATRYEAVGRSDDTDAMFLALLDAMPGDAELSNHVGYVWAQAGRRLNEAQRLIEAALEADKDQSAYLDSMGWVRYKQGDLAGAEQWLRRASDAPDGDNPVILDHLGDTLYRLGRKDEAAELWRRALAGMEDPRNQASGDPEMETLPLRATAKLEALRAVEAGGPGVVPVAPLGEGLAEPGLVPLP